MVYQIPKFFPTPEIENLVICLSMGEGRGLPPLITNLVPDLHLIGDSQCFPLYYWEEEQVSNQLSIGQTELVNGKSLVRRDGVSDYILKEMQAVAGAKVKKEDVFYYVYGFLHNPQYREKYSADLKKMLPRLPLPTSGEDFWAYSKAGRELADLHLNYETQAPGGLLHLIGETHNKVTKMRFLKKEDKSVIVVNDTVWVINIPLEAYEYVVNGKSAIEWVMERYQISTHKDSGIVNDPNDWAVEQGKPNYILDLLQSVITVSVETMKIVKSLPALEEVEVL